MCIYSGFLYDCFLDGCFLDASSTAAAYYASTKILKHFKFRLSRQKNPNTELC